MSRSYRHHYIFKTAGDKSFKKIFNRRLRRSSKCENIPDGNAYRKYNNSWEIADYVYRYNDYEEYREANKEFETEEQSRKKWKKWFKGGKQFQDQIEESKERNAAC